MRKSSLRHSITEASFPSKKQDKKVKIVLTPVNNDVIGSFKKKNSVQNIRFKSDPKAINYDDLYEDRDINVIKEESFENEDPLMKVKRLSLRGKELAKMRKTLQNQNTNLNFEDLYEDRDEKIVKEEEKEEKEDPLMKVKRLSLRGKELAKMRKTLQQQNQKSNLNFEDLYEDRDEKIVKEELKKQEEEEKEDPLMKVKRMSLRGKELAKMRKAIEEENKKKESKKVNKNYKRLNTDFNREEAVMDELSLRFFGPRKISNLDEITINTIGINPSIEINASKNYYVNKKLKEEKKKK